MGLFGLWIFFAILVGVVGKDRNIGFGWAFFWALILSPLIGIIIALLSDKKKPISNDVDKWKHNYEEAKKAEYKGQNAIAIDFYMNTLYYLENDNTKISKSSETYKQELITRIKSRVKNLKQMEVLK